MLRKMLLGTAVAATLAVPAQPAAADKFCVRVRTTNPFETRQADPACTPDTPISTSPEEVCVRQEPVLAGCVEVTA